MNRFDRSMLTPTARLALHMNAAQPAARKRDQPTAYVRIWGGWSHLALLLLASAVIAVVTWQILRRGL